MLASLLLTAAVWPLSVTQYCQPSDKTIMIGIAQAPAGNFLYCEHVEQIADQSFIINYIRDGKIFAEKKINYSINPATPSVNQKDFRTGELRKADITSKTINLEYKSNSRKKSTHVSIPHEEVDVVDAGFDNFVRNHWGELQEGESLSVNFASIPHLKVLPLRIRAQASIKCATEARVTVESFCFVVEIDNSLLRLVLGNIKLTYDRQRRLVNFNGVVNIEDEKESTQAAKINYYYQIDYFENK